MIFLQMASLIMTLIVMTITIIVIARSYVNSMMEPNFRLVDIRNTTTIAQKRCVSRYYDEIMIMIMIMIILLF